MPGPENKKPPAIVRTGTVGTTVYGGTNRPPTSSRRSRKQRRQSRQRRQRKTRRV